MNQKLLRSLSKVPVDVVNDNKSVALPEPRLKRKLERTCLTFILTTLAQTNIMAQS